MKMVKLKGLGKGLDALFLASKVSGSLMPTNINDADSSYQHLAIEKIKAGSSQPRKVFDEDGLQELAVSIKHNGVIQPIVVRKSGNSYELIAGERRFRASKIAGIATIPAIVRDISDEEALAIALIENIQRKDLNIIEESLGYKRLIDEYNLTHGDLAKVTGKSRSHITNILRLLNLVEDVQNLLMSGKLDMGHARALLALPIELQLSVASYVVEKSLTTSEVEKYVSNLIKNQDSLTSPAALNHVIDPDVIKLETQIADKLGMLVNIKHSRSGNGRVTISYASLDELDTLLKYLALE
jgi:ParB family chromosome partitioning protein